LLEDASARSVSDGGRFLGRTEKAVDVEIQGMSSKSILSLVTQERVFLETMVTSLLRGNEACLE
jgi:hypothetical protein